MKFSRLFWIGISISTSIVIFVFGLLYLQDIPYFNKASLTFTIMFDNVQGLNDGDSVNMLGKRIGKVSSTKIRGKRIAVEVSINQDFSFNIPIDSKIEVKSDGIMGSKFISIEPGNNTKKSIIDGDLLEGGIREVDFTAITPGIMPITQDLAIFSRRLKALLGEKQKDDIRNTLTNVQSLTQELDSLIKDVHTLVSNDKDRNNLSEFFQNMNSVSKSLDNLTTEKAENILDDMEDITSNFSESSKSLSSSTKRLDNLIEGIEEGNGSLGKLIKGDGLIDNMNGLINDIRFLIEDFNENTEEYLKKYIRASKKVKKEK